MPTALIDSRQTPRFAGLCTFCRAPRLAEVAAEHLPVDWILYGVPFDGGVTYRPGARFGPRAVREHSQYVKPYLGAADGRPAVHLAERFSIADGGDAPISPYSCAESMQRVVQFAKELGDPRRSRLLAIGGDHSIAYANIRATAERLGRPAGGMALLHFDAHLDTVDSVWGERWGHASPFARAVEEGLIDPGAMLSIGIRGGLNSPHDLEFARSRGVEIIGADRVASGEAMSAVLRFCERVSGRPLYVSFDVDALDPAFAPGTGTPVCGGLSTREAFALLRAASGSILVGADIVEVLPERDCAGITALAASELMAEILAASAPRWA
jgi:agmatinase